MSKPFNVTVNDQYQFELSDETRLDVVQESQGQYHVLDNGTAYRIEVQHFQPENRQFQIAVNGASFSVHLADQYEQLIKAMGLNNSQQQKQNSLKAPMPGLVLEIQVQVGQTVSKGDTLLILEAMKMENVLKAAADGVIKSIHVQKGAAVEKGALLLELE